MDPNFAKGDTLTYKEGRKGGSCVKIKVVGREGSGVKGKGSLRRKLGVGVEAVEEGGSKGVGSWAGEFGDS